MKPPQRTEAERIAGTLTKAQRRVLVNAVTGPSSTMRVLAERGLYYFGSKSINVVGGRARYTILPDGFTVLGLAVREVLLSQEQTDER